jgi:hypothetical protein
MIENLYGTGVGMGKRDSGGEYLLIKDLGIALDDQARAQIAQQLSISQIRRQLCFGDGSLNRSPGALSGLLDENEVLAGPGSRRELGYT